jgi:hypothetical protein
MLQELLQERKEMLSLLQQHIKNTQHASRDNMVKIILNFDANVL